MAGGGNRTQRSVRMTGRAIGGSGRGRTASGRRSCRRSADAHWYRSDPPGSSTVSDLPLTFRWHVDHPHAGEKTPPRENRGPADPLDRSPPGARRQDRPTNQGNRDSTRKGEITLWIACGRAGQGASCPSSNQAWSVSCSAWVKHAVFAASVAGLPVQPRPWGMLPFWMRWSARSPTVIPAAVPEFC